MVDRVELSWSQPRLLHQRPRLVAVHNSMVTSTSTHRPNCKANRPSSMSNAKTGLASTLICSRSPRRIGRGCAIKSVKTQIPVRETNTKVVAFYEHLGFEVALCAIADCTSTLMQHRRPASVNLLEIHSYVKCEMLRHNKA